MKLFFVTLITLPAYAGNLTSTSKNKCPIDSTQEYVVVANYPEQEKFIVTSFHGKLALAQCEYYIQQSGDPKYMYCIGGLSD